jgi:hypothetical protein
LNPLLKSTLQNQKRKKKDITAWYARPQKQKPPTLSKAPAA